MVVTKHPTIKQAQDMIINDSSIQINTKISLTKNAAKQIVDQAFNGLKRMFTKRSIEELAWETGFIKRSSSKLGGFDFLASLLISSIDGAHASLEKISDILAHVGRRTSVTSQAIMKRINNENAVNFLKSAFSKIMNERVLKLNEIAPSLLKTFSKVLLQDSSTVILDEKLQVHFKGSGGRASKASAKFDVIYDYKAKEYEAIRLTDQREADQNLALNIDDVLTENSLVIRDLGYLRIDSLIRIIAKKSFFLSRLKSNMLVYLNREDENPVDLGVYLAKHCKHGVFDQVVFITAKKLQVRLVAYKAPEEVVNKRRRDAIATAKKQGRTFKASTLKFFAFTVFITNVSADIWKADVIGTIYRIRWQIELIFKCWKSRVQIHYLIGTSKERIMCLIYARLIFILLVNEIYKLADFIGTHRSGKMVSMPKVFEWIKDTGRLIKIINGSMRSWEKHLFIETISRSMCMQTRNRKTTLEIICECELFGLKTS